MKQFKMVIYLFTLIFAFAFIAQAQSGVSYRMSTENQMFDIEPQALGSALKAYEMITDINLDYSEEIVKRKKTNGVRGTHTLSKALEKMLMGTGLSYMVTAQGLVALKETEAVELEKTVVTGTKTERFLENLPISVEVITREQIEAANIDTVQDALRFLTGVDARDTRGKVEMLGLDGKYTMYLIDSLDYSYTGSMGASTDFRDLPIELVERIEVVKGPSSSLYGSGAVGGVINIITRGAPKKPTYYVTGSFDAADNNILKFTGEQQPSVLGFTGGQTIDKFGFFINYDRRDAPERGLVAKNYQVNLDYEFNPTSKLTLKNRFGDRVITSTRSITEYDEPSISLEWKMKPDNLSNLALRGSYFSTTQKGRSAFTGEPSENETEKREGEVLYSRLLMGIHTVSLGYNYKYESVSQPNYHVEDEQGDHGLVIQDEIDFESVFAPLTIVLGTRIDHFDSWGTQFNPSAAALYKVPSPDLRFRAQAGMAFKAPTVAQLYRDMWSHGGWFMVNGNPDLEPEEAFGYQLGVEYRPVKNLSAKVTFFDTEVTDKITSYTTGEECEITPGEFIRILSYRNVPEDHTQVLTLDVSGQLGQHLSAKLGYTRIFEAEYSSDGDQFLTVQDRQRDNFTAEANVVNVGPAGFNLRGEYVGERWVSGGRGNPDVKAKGYWLAHAKLTLDIDKVVRYIYPDLPKNAGAHLSFAVNNIFDKEVESSGDTEGGGTSACLRIKIGCF